MLRWWFLFAGSKRTNSYLRPGWYSGDYALAFETEQEAMEAAPGVESQCLPGTQIPVGWTKVLSIKDIVMEGGKPKWWVVDHVRMSHFARGKYLRTWDGPFSTRSEALAEIQAMQEYDDCGDTKIIDLRRLVLQDWPEDQWDSLRVSPDGDLIS